MARIKKISMRNFKSFRRATLPIPEGFTAIVGPNGSGKSNIIDAICFVLGRSSAKSLRAERFSDVIFNGGNNGDTAKSAEVSLYLDNVGREIDIDSKEVKITRNIDLTGKSEYRLNGNRTSRTEILDVLSSALIHPDGHNIVLQGDITGFIEMTPIERRGILDEIAGIAEYDEKKRKALRELEKVNDNLTTVDAVLSEVKLQMKKLEKEKDDAVKYEKLKKEVRESEAILLKAKYSDINEGLEGLEKGLGLEEKNRDRFNRYLRILQGKSDGKKKQLEDLNSAIIKEEGADQFEVYKESERLRNEVAYGAEKVQTIKDEIERSKERSAYLRNSIEEIRREIAEHQRINESLKGECKKIDEEINTLQAEVEESYSKITDEDKTAMGQKEELLKLKEELEDRQKELLELERESTILGEKREQKKSVLGEIKNNIQNKNQKINHFQEIIGEIRHSIESINNKIELNIKDKKDVYTHNISNKESILKIEKSLEEKISVHAKLEAKYKALDDIKNRRISFNKAINTIIKLRDEKQISGIYGTISELGKVDSGFSTALEIAAGKGLQYIVVENDNVAERCIQYLKRNKVGRASFLPLNKLRERPPSINALAAAKKSYGFAIDLVEFDKKYEKAFFHVFRDTVVIDDIDFARKIGIGEVRMVTLDGDLIEVSGKMSGGHYSKSILGFEESSTSEKGLKKLENEIKKLELEKKNLLETGVAFEEKLDELALIEVELKKKQEILKERQKSIQENAEEVARELEEKKDVLSGLSATLKEINQEIEKNNKALNVVFSALSVLKETQLSIEKTLEGSKAEKIYNEIKDLESRIFQLEKEKESKNNQINLNSSKIDEVLSLMINEHGDEIKNLELACNELSVESKNILDQKKELEEKLSKVKVKEDVLLGKIGELKDQKEGLQNAIQKINAKTETIRSWILHTAERIEEIKIEKARLETRYNDVETAFDEYQDLEIDIEEDLDLDALESKIEKLKTRMERLEPINMRAIEDFEMVNEKFGALFEKIEKLVAERQAIKDLMKEIEQRKYEIFMEVYENIHLNFRRIFEQLSGGGTGELLLDPESPLDGGLTIIAKPPGKNPQMIESLSGGEKTLTALSFIFAIQRYHPAPFYILDEIDMFLDEENVVKIAELIKESSKEAQFIVVSLRDTLMTLADQLFGISNDNGVSKIIGVELEEVEA